MLRHSCILGDPQTKGDKIRSGCLTPAFSGAQKRAEVLRHPCILGDPLQRGTKSELAASPIGVGIGNSPKSCPARTLRANAPPDAAAADITSAGAPAVLALVLVLVR